jgi:hypothetical protein
MPLPVKGFEIAIEETHREQHPCRDYNIVQFEIILDVANSGKAVVAEPVPGIGNITHAFAVRGIEHQIHIAEVIRNASAGDQAQ